MHIVCSYLYVMLRFSASDGKGGIAAADVTINMCNCSGHGTCVFDLLADGYELKQTFRIVQCLCSTGWEGAVSFLTLIMCDYHQWIIGRINRDINSYFKSNSLFFSNISIIVIGVSRHNMSLM